MKPFSPPTHEEGEQTYYIVRTFHKNQRPRTWHSGTLESCRAWVKNSLSKPGAPPHAIYRKHLTWSRDLVE